LPNTPWIAIIALLIPVVCYLLQLESPVWFNGYMIGIEILLLNGIVTFSGLWLLSDKKQKNAVSP
jgi:hypothetical protein